MAEAIIRAWQRPMKEWLHHSLLLCCVLAVSHVAIAEGRDLDRRNLKTQEQNFQAATPDSRFAIGDFDGDREPDLATVEIGRFNSLHSRYWISLQLSTGRLQTVGVTGPAGGLVLLARDVNGDRALDLVLVTAWRHELVGVLLNDGEGNFSAADPGQFHIDAVSSRTRIGNVPRFPEDRAALSFQYSALRDQGRKIPAARESGPAFSRGRNFAVRLIPSSFSGRAPPKPFLHV